MAPAELHKGDSFVVVVPPMVVFTGKHFNSQLSNGEVPGTLHSMLPNGWMNIAIL